MLCFLGDFSFLDIGIGRLFSLLWIGGVGTSVKSSEASSEVNEEVESFEKNKLMYMTLNGSEMDMGLLSKLQKRIQFLESERKDFVELGYVKSGGKNSENDFINNNHRELAGDKSSPQYAIIER